MGENRKSRLAWLEEWRWRLVRSSPGIARVECAHRSGDIPVPVLPAHRGRNAPSPFLGFLAGHHRSTDGLGVGEDSGLDGFVFGWLAHSTGLGW
jgi:hypothetical protein